MKRLLLIILSIFCLFVFASCGENEDPPEQKSSLIGIYETNNVQSGTTLYPGDTYNKKPLRTDTFMVILMHDGKAFLVEEDVIYTDYTWEDVNGSASIKQNGVSIGGLRVRGDHLTYAQPQPPFKTYDKMGETGISGVYNLVNFTVNGSLFEVGKTYDGETLNANDVIAIFNNGGDFALFVDGERVSNTDYIWESAGELTKIKVGDNKSYDVIKDGENYKLSILIKNVNYDFVFNKINVNGD